MYLAMDRLSYKLVASKSELKGAFEVRRQVFVEEQGISEDLVYDEYDVEALHIVVKDRRETEMPPFSFDHQLPLDEHWHLCVPVRVHAVTVSLY